MSSVGSTGSTGGTSTTTTNSSSGLAASTLAATDSLSSLTVNDFLQLMITTLENQDPLNPTDTNTIMQQVGTLSQITSTDQLTQTLDSVQIGENLNSAAGLIGKTVTGTDASSNPVSGVVDSVTVSSSAPVLQIGDSQVALASVTSVQPTD